MTDAKVLRVFHGPLNIVGAGGYMASHQRKRGHVAHFITFWDHTKRQNHDINLKLDKVRVRSQVLARIGLFMHCCMNYKVFHFYFAKTLLPWGLDLPILRLLGKKIVMQYCGSDVRLIEIEKKRNPYWHLLHHKFNDPTYDAMKRRRMRWQSLWVHRAIVVRNLVNYVDQYYPTDRIVMNLWVHNSFDFKTMPPITPRADQFGAVREHVPVLVHAPSDPVIKGTMHVREAVEQLKAEGYSFEYKEVHGVPNDEAQRIYREEADIILDQFLLGGVGNLAMEGMAAGKPVVGYLIDEVKERYCPDIPLINATIDTLKARIAELLDNPDGWKARGEAGRAFVEKYCDRDVIGDQLIELYDGL